MNAIFLSASVPVPGREGFDTASPYLIREAVSALVEVALGRRLLVWGGHPAITPMIWAASERLGVDYATNVRLYQSLFFKDQFPEDNTRFKNVVFTDARGDRNASLEHMRRRMLSESEFDAAVFVGGMEGIREEFQLAKEFVSLKSLIPIPSPGGVARTLFSDWPEAPRDLENALDFTHWLYTLLQIAPNAPRAGVERKPRAT